MLNTKTTLHNSKFANSVLGLLVAANGFLLVGFAKARKDGVENYFRRTFAASVDFSANDSNIVDDVQKYISEQSQKDLSTKVKSGFVPETIFQIAQTYRDKGDRSANLTTKARNYSLALLELEKLTQKEPWIVKQTKPLKQQIRIALQSISTVGVAFGDKRDKIELLYGLADKNELSDRYYPIGSIRYLTYDKTGLKFGLRDNRVFAINIRSNFKGVVGGVQIGDSIAGIKALYQGKVYDHPGNNFAYQSEQSKNQRLTFVFSDHDDLVDGIKLFNRKLYGSWSTALR
jgi:hypothetical protein